MDWENIMNSEDKILTYLNSNQQERDVLLNSFLERYFYQNFRDGEKPAAYRAVELFIKGNCPNNCAYCYLKRHGKEVIEENFQNEDAVLDEIFLKAKLGEDEYETAAIITMTETEAFTLYQMLKARGEEVHYIDRNSSAFKKGLTVTTFYLAKGLEFDQVFGVFRDIENPMQNQAKYICATRALHELYMYQVTKQ